MVDTLDLRGERFVDPQGKIFEVEIADGENGNPIQIPPFRGNGASCTISPAAGASGKIQATTSLDSDVELGNAEWEDWDQGVVSTITTDVLAGPVTAIRGVSSSGVITIRVVI